MWSKEPALSATSVAALVGAALVLLREFGVPLTEGQHTAIMAFAAVLLPIIAGLWTRSRVTPVAAQKE